MSNNSPDKSKRKSTRFTPDPGTLAKIDPQGHEGGKFQPTSIGLVVSESHQGCGLVVLGRPGEIKVGDVWKVKVGELEPLAAEIRWVSTLDEQVARLGLMYLA